VLHQPKLFKPQPLNLVKTQIAKKIEQTHVILGGYANNYQRDLKERLPFYLGRMILAGGMGSKLSLKIREELGLAYYIGISLQEFIETGYYGVCMGVDHGRVGDAVTAVFSELKGFLAGDFNDQDLERARNLMIGNFIIFMETSDDAAGWYGGQIAQGQPLVTIEEEIKMINKISRAEIIAAWEQWLRNDNMQIVTFGNKDQDLSGLSL
jgi:zinc protease